MRPLRAGLVLASLLALLQVGAPAAAEPSPAYAMMERTVAEVLAILKDPSGTPETRRDALEQIAYDRFNFRRMSKLVLHRNWKRFSEEQQGEFVDEFTKYLADDYGSRIERYSQEEVAILGEQAEPRGDVTVKTKIVGGENDGALVDYRLRDEGGDWKIIDVVIEGISMVANFRDQFRDAMGKGTPEDLLQKLRDKNVETFAPTDA